MQQLQVSNYVYPYKIKYLNSRSNKPSVLSELLNIVGGPSQGT